jgi:hypothetical protein
VQSPNAPNHALQRPAITLWLQSWLLAGRVAELGSLADCIQELRMTKPSKKSQQVIVPILAAIIGIVGTAAVSFQTIWLSTAKAKKESARANRMQRLAFYQTVRVHLEASEAAFKSQVALRERLVESLEHRYAALNMQYEPLFRMYYSKMNDEELFLCKQMRGLTEALNTHNTAVRDLLTTNAVYYAELPEFRPLYEHLDLWISKYNHPFKDTQEACLVYVGVEEGKPFPTGIGDRIQQKISELESETNENR